ncbi:proline dehydrogenase family protein [Mucilaginibacter sp. CAU 1740]|uniref:proline dehydrogenase family protein n=1 Tax=Mucilaginibacter sp. CAU 1740 TaxID=3140365 RepID=UPI00325ABB55
MEKELLKLGAAALRKAALDENAKSYILKDPLLFGLLKKAANRYIGGETLNETIAKINALNGIKCSIEFMGESTRNAEEANQASAEFLNICRCIGSDRLNATVSLDLSHIGLAVDADLCLQNLEAICTEAALYGTEVIISAEGTERTDAVLQTYQKAALKHNNIAITLQAYLHRTADDFKEVVKTNGRIRIVKGAFQTAENLALPRGEKLDEIYLSYIEQLLARGHKCSIATHHDKIQQAAKKLVDQYRPSSVDYEFESLFGINNEQLQILQQEGYQTKIYFVYGKEWYLYLCNRLAEYPQNLFRALNDIVA